MQIEMQIQNNQLIVNVLNLENGWELRGYYLYKDGNLVKKAVKDNINSIYQFPLTSSGIYYVNVYAKNEGKMTTIHSNSISYFTEEDKKKFEKFLNKKVLYKTGCNKQLELYSLTEPFQMFAYVQSKQTIQKGELIKKLNKKFYQTTTKYGTLITDREIKKVGNSITIFSGVCKYKKDILVGNKDINEKIDLNELKESYGNFSLFFENQEKVEITTDYFGTQSIYYYHTNETTIISNEYHLLLLIMANLKINMKLDTNIVMGNFCLPIGQFFEQRISSQMDVKGIQKLPVEKYIQIDEQGFKLKETSMVQLLKQKFDISKYDEYLVQAAEEIMENINVTYKSEKFSNVIVDVTGGVDSRIIFSAVTNIKSAYDKTKICSNDVKITNDIKVAIPLNNLYKYQYDTLPEIYYSENYKKGNKILRSINMGTYYYIGEYAGKSESNQVIRLMGGGGEVITRPYYARFLLKENIAETQSSVEFVKDFLYNRVDKMILGYKDGARLVETIMKEELENTIGDTILEKYENMYTNLRSGVHFNHRANQTASFVKWFPLYSKTAFYLKMKTFHKFKNMKLALDLIQYFNPTIAKVPYEKQINNEEYQSIKDTLVSFSYQEYNDNIELKMDNDRTRWENAKKEKEKNIKIIGKKVGKYTREERYKDLMEIYHYLMNQSEELKNKIGLPIYYWLTNNEKTNVDLTVMYNKIYSLIDQLNIIRNGTN